MTPEILKQYLAKAPMRKSEASGNIITCPVRLAGPLSLFKPMASQNPAQQPKYIARLLFPAAADVSLLKQEAAAVAKAEFSSTAGLRNPIREQAEKAGYDGYEDGGIFVNASNTRRPGLVDRSGRHPITDEAELYAGAWVIASINFYAYNAQGNRGVGVGLNNIQKIADDEPIGGGAKPEDEFTPLTDLPEAGAGESLDNIW